MKTYLDCYPCFMRQALSAARRAGASDDQQRQILLKTMEQLQNLPADATPPQMAYQIHLMIKQLTKISDPYRLAKEEATKKAYVDRNAAWLFVVGRDIFEENIQRFKGDVKPGRYCLVMFGDGCIGYGRFETSGDRRVIKNMFDVGDFLRRE